MSVRDEMLAKVDEAWSFGPDVIVDVAIMPIVERVAKDTIEAYKRSGLLCAAPECEACQDTIDDIVRRVCGE